METKKGGKKSTKGQKAKREEGEALLFLESTHRRTAKPTLKLKWGQNQEKTPKEVRTPVSVWVRGGEWGSGAGRRTVWLATAAPAGETGRPRLVRKLGTQSIG